MVDSLDDRSGRPGAWSASGSSSPSLLAQATKAFAFSSSTNEDEPSHPVPDPQALQLISSPFPRVESWLMPSLCWSFCLTFWPSFRTWCFLYLRWDGNYWMSDLVDNAWSALGFASPFWAAYATQASTFSPSTREAELHTWVLSERLLPEFLYWSSGQNGNCLLALHCKLFISTSDKFSPAGNFPNIRPCKISCILFFHERKLAPITIKGYKAMLLSAFQQLGLWDVGLLCEILNFSHPDYFICVPLTCNQLWLAIPAVVTSPCQTWCPQ